MTTRFEVQTLIGQRFPASLWLWSPLRGGVSLSEAGQKARAPRAPPSCRGSSVLQPTPRRRGHRNCSTASRPHRWRFSGCARLLARCRRRRPEAAPAEGRLLCLGAIRSAWLWSPLRGGVSLSEAGQKARAPRAPPSCRGNSVLQPAPRRRGHRNCSTASCPHRWRFSGCAGLLARCRRRRPGKRAGRRPAPCEQRSARAALTPSRPGSCPGAS